MDRRPARRAERPHDRVRTNERRRLRRAHAADARSGLVRGNEGRRSGQPVRSAQRRNGIGESAPDRTRTSPFSERRDQRGHDCGPSHERRRCRGLGASRIVDNGSASRSDACPGRSAPVLARPVTATPSPNARRQQHLQPTAAATAARTPAATPKRNPHAGTNERVRSAVATLPPLPIKSATPKPRTPTPTLRISTPKRPPRRRPRRRS